MTEVDDLLFLDLSVRDVVNECPADTATAAGVDETILRTGVESVLAIDKLRMEHDVALLALRLEVGQTVPVDEVFRAGDSSRSGSCREVTGVRIVVTLSTEDAIDPAVLMGGETHVVDVRSGNGVLGHGDRLGPETEVINAVRTLCHCEEANLLKSSAAGEPLYGT